jgi:hypothetical protein
MSAMRFSVLAVLLFAGAALGSTTDSCGAAMGTQKLYANTTGTICTAASTCYTTYCTCLGATHSSGLMCTTPTTKPSCATATKCVTDVMTCLNKASGDMTCSNLKDLHLSILSLESGLKLYNESMAYYACRYRSCSLINETAGNCTISYDSVCVAPVIFRGTLLLKGNFTAILASPEQRELLAKAIEKDLIKTLGFVDVFVNRLYAYGTPENLRPPFRTRAPATRRRQGDQALVIEYEVPGVSSKNTNFNSKLAVVAANGNWLVEAKSEYSTLTGGQTLTFLGASEGTGSGAFSSGKLNSLVGSLTPAPVPVTPSPTSGAAMQSLLAAAVVALLSAMLF